MGYLIIKNIDTNKLFISESKSYYTISYNTKYINLSSIPIILQDVSIKEEYNGYYVYLHGKESIQLLQTLDRYLASKIDNYKPILHFNTYYYIFFKKNSYIETLFKNFNETEIIINIIKFKKHASHTYPIVYIL